MIHTNLNPNQTIDFILKEGRGCWCWRARADLARCAHRHAHASSGVFCRQFHSYRSILRRSHLHLGQAEPTRHLAKPSESVKSTCSVLREAFLSIKFSYIIRSLLMSHLRTCRLGSRTPTSTSARVCGVARARDRVVVNPDEVSYLSDCEQNI